MVCSKCQAKLTKVVTPDPWKSQGSGPSGGASGSGHRKLNENKALSKTSRFTPYSVSQKCRLCNQKVHQKGSFYCQDCAYKKSICSMCGKKLMSTAKYAQSSN